LNWKTPKVAVAEFQTSEARQELRATESERRLDAIELSPRIAFLNYDTGEAINYAAYTADNPGPLDFDVRAGELLIHIGCEASVSVATPPNTTSLRMSYSLTRLTDNSVIEAAADARSAILSIFTQSSSNTIATSISYHRKLTNLLSGRYRLQAYYKTAGPVNPSISNRYISAEYFPRTQ